MIVKFNYIEMLYHVFEVDVAVDSLDAVLEKVESGEVVLDMSPDTVVESTTMLEGIASESQEVLIVNKKV